MESLLWWVKRVLNYFFLCRWQIIKMNREGRKKRFNPLMDICDFPLSDDKSRKFWWSKHHLWVINWWDHLDIHQSLFAERFVVEGLMCFTPQSVGIWEQPLVSQPPAAFMGVSPAQKGAQKRTPTWLWVDHWSISLKTFFLLHLNANRGQTTSLLPMSSCLHASSHISDKLWVT